MIIRKYTACPACQNPLMLRIGVGYAKRQFITVACDSCESVSRGELIAEGDWPEIALPGMPDLNINDHCDWQVVTLHADFPIPFPSTTFSPYLAAAQYLGDRAPIYFSGVGRFHHLSSKIDDFQRAYELHIRERWDLANENIAKFLHEDWDTNAITADCQEFFHRYLFLSTLFIDPIGRWSEAKWEVWSRIFKKETEFAGAATRLNSDGMLRRLQTRISEQLFFLVRNSNQWMAAVPILHAKAYPKRAPSDWRIPTDDFQSLRDAYRQNFELSCQALSLVIRMQNIAEGRDAEVIRIPGGTNAWIPRTAGPRAPSNLRQFERSNSATKELFLNRSTRLRHLWGVCFDRGLRNAISHADADYSVKKGAIYTSKGNFYYHDFLGSVAWQVCLMAFWLDLIKLWRKYATCWDSTKRRIVNK
ncbi:hypothetical protein ABZY93_29150 [Streptomyces smyrnaeus]|uniref:hypothetical protein n=1 Tax=Streptomyces smyrnaeus TaxID=1387713 RepID=UPI0033B9AED0